MAMDAKVEFLNFFEERLSKEITADAMNKALKAAADVLEGMTSMLWRNGQRRKTTA